MDFQEALGITGNFCEENIQNWDKTKLSTWSDPSNYFLQEQWHYWGSWTILQVSQLLQKAFISHKFVIYPDILNHHL